MYDVPGVWVAKQVVCMCPDYTCMSKENTYSESPDMWNHYVFKFDFTLLYLKCWRFFVYT